MDHIELLHQVKSLSTIELAFHYALHDRKSSDDYFDHCEIEYVQSYKEKIIQEIQKEISNPEQFQVRVAYTYYSPKNDLCYRRMTYIPFKDLVVRYAFCIVLAKHLDRTLSNRCFANRRAKGTGQEESFLENFFKISLPRSRRWQKECVDKYSVLIRTDISAFYDSISHQYLVESLLEQLSINIDSQFIKIFQKLLSLPIISYSTKTKTVQRKKHLHQGLATGNTTEGFLANLYLKDVDEAMESVGIEFGRYSDDMKIFTHNRQVARTYLLILQEHLLKKGLNLNQSKTLIAENEEEMQKILKKFDSSERIQFPIKKKNLHQYIDQEIDELLKDFNPNKDIKTDEDAKNFCKFISNKNQISIKKRTISHIDKLHKILTHWQGSSKHASWLLIECLYDQDTPEIVKSHATKVLFKVLDSQEALAYTKYRLIHHLINPKSDTNKLRYRIIDKFSDKQKQKITNNLIDFLRQPAFELNIIALYTLKVLGYNIAELDNYVQKYSPKPIGEPIINALYYLNQVEILS